MGAKRRRKAIFLLRMLLLVGLSFSLVWNIVSNCTFSETQERIWARESGKGILDGATDRIAVHPDNGAVYYLNHGKLHKILSCEQCGDVPNLCSSFPVVNWLDVESWPVSLDFVCSEAILTKLAANFSVPEPSLVSAYDGSVYYIHGKTCAYLTSFVECGPLYGDLRGQLPHLGKTSLFFLSQVGQWSGEAEGSSKRKGPVFRCGQHTDIIANFEHRRSNWKRWMIMTPPSCVDLANIFSQVLFRNGFQVTTMTDFSMAAEDVHDIYIVIFNTADYPFERLPPASKRIVVQGSSSLNIASDEYFDTLFASSAVIEMSLYNLKVLKRKGINGAKLWYLPLGTNQIMTQHVLVSKNWDLIYVSDITGIPRRIVKLLEYLSEQFDIKVVGEADDDLNDFIQKSRFLLSFCREATSTLDVHIVARSLALNVPVIAERTVDTWSHQPFLKSAVYFFEPDSMHETIAKALAGSASAQMQEARRVAEVAIDRAEFGFNRILVGLGVFSITQTHHIFSSQPDLRYPTTLTEPVIISTPEAPERFSTQLIREDDPLNRTFFSVRLIGRPSWISIGMGYSTIARMALNRGLSTLAIAEDDVAFPKHKNRVSGILQKYLNENDLWDLFSGLIADLHQDTKILSASCFEGIQFVTVDKMTSMVYNIYNLRALEALSSWDPSFDDSSRNTIDRYLEMYPSLRVVTTLPFFAGHNVSMTSTAWFETTNAEYARMISQSQQKLYTLLLDYLEGMNYGVASDMVCPQILINGGKQL